jgi:hypothetical protein
MPAYYPNSPSAEQHIAAQQSPPLPAMDRTDLAKIQHVEAVLDRQ